jgi:hypothetical protein
MQIRPFFGLWRSSAASGGVSCCGIKRSSVAVKWRKAVVLLNARGTEKLQLERDGEEEELWGRGRVMGIILNGMWYKEV